MAVWSAHDPVFLIQHLSSSQQIVIILRHQLTFKTKQCQKIREIEGRGRGKMEPTKEDFSEDKPTCSGMIPIPSLMKPLDPNSKRSLDEQQEGGEDEPVSKQARTDNRKIFIGNLPSNVTEKPLVAYFRTFGHVVDCCVVRDRETGISRGFAFLTFLDDDEADAAVQLENHVLDGKPIRVSYSQKGQVPHARKINESNMMDSLVLPRNQTKIFIGPLSEDVNSGDIMTQLGAYGVIKGVSKICQAGKKSFALVDYKDSISVRRVFTNKIFVKGKYCKVTCSKLAMELMLSRTVVFFYEAHQYCDKRTLEKHFSQYGQVFRTFQFLQEDNHPCTYGFVDFIGEDSIRRSVESKQQLVKEQFIRVSKFLPQALMYDLLSMSEKNANAMLRKIEQSVPDQGIWGSQGFKDSSEHTSSQVRIPTKMVAKLIGERGRTITEICRDSKTKITISRVQSDDEPNIILTITGTKMNIKTAQYIMQKLLKK